jgi:transglutaminase-like putative cysteine protease
LWEREKDARVNRMKYRVRHTTSYTYRRPVDLAAHMLHLLPRALPQQVVSSADIVSTPAAARSTDGTDHFGNRVSWLFLDLPHAAFEVRMSASIDVGFGPPPEAAATPTWESIATATRTGGVAAWQVAEFAFASPMAPADPAVGAYAAASFPAGRPVLAGLLDLSRRINRDFTFRSGVTTIATPVARVLRLRAGVCQDFSHVMIAGLRALGLPARYVSGYIRTRPPPGRTARRGADQSHAWVGAWLGPEHGWIGLDPTNDVVVQDEHVVLGWGRDYGDVSPVRGVLLGGGSHKLSVSVDLEAV